MFLLQPIVLIDYVDVSQFNKDNAIIEEEVEEEEDFDMDSLVNEFIGWYFFVDVLIKIK